MNSYAAEIKVQISQVKEAAGPEIKSGEDFYKMCKDIAKLDRESFHVITMNQKNKVIDRYLVSLGTLTASLVHPREVFKPAILDSAACVAFVHNHPSGDPTPSGEDLKLTKRLQEAGKILGIRILDHVIVGDSYISFLDEDLL